MNSSRQQKRNNNSSKSNHRWKRPKTINANDKPDTNKPTKRTKPNKR